MSEFTYGVGPTDPKRIGDAMRAAAYPQASTSDVVTKQVDAAVAVVTAIAGETKRALIAVSQSGNVEDADHFVLNVSCMDPEPDPVPDVAGP